MNVYELTPIDYEAIAIEVIRKYLNKDFTDDEIKIKFSLAIKILINNSLKLSGSKTSGVKSYSEGGQSVTFKDGVEAWTITDDIKAVLPTPYVRMW